MADPTCRHGMGNPAACIDCMADGPVGPPTASRRPTDRARPTRWEQTLTRDEHASLHLDAFERWLTTDRPTPLGDGTARSYRNWVAQHHAHGGYDNAAEATVQNIGSATAAHDEYMAWRRRQQLEL